MARLFRSLDSDDEVEDSRKIAAGIQQRQYPSSRAPIRRKASRQLESCEHAEISLARDSGGHAPRLCKLVPKKKIPEKSHARQVCLARHHSTVQWTQSNSSSSKQILLPKPSKRNGSLTRALEETSSIESCSRPVSAKLNPVHIDSGLEGSFSPDGVPHPMASDEMLSRSKSGLVESLAAPIQLTRQLQTPSLAQIDDCDHTRDPQRTSELLQSRNRSFGACEKIDTNDLASYRQGSILQRPSTPSSFRKVPSESRLRSPSKKMPRIQTQPVNSASEAFWTAEAVNSWNEQNSPEKLLKSPSKSKLHRRLEEPELPCASLGKTEGSSRMQKQERLEFDRRKNQLAIDFVEELDQRITAGSLSNLTAQTGGIKVVWSRTLSTTVGRANWKRERTTRSLAAEGDAPSLIARDFASIELAEKIISDESRLLNVLAHEFCHLANFMISGVKGQPHGTEFKRWGRLCSQAFHDRGIEVTTKHSYEIEYKYAWKCLNEDCSAEFQRHSKSIDVRRHKCGRCRSPLVQIRPAPRQVGGNKRDQEGHAGGAYAAYVKQKFQEVKQGLPTGSSQKEIMAAIGQKYRGERQAATLSQPPLLLHAAKPLASSVDDVAKCFEAITLSD